MQGVPAGEQTQPPSTQARLQQSAAVAQPASTGWHWQASLKQLPEQQLFAIEPQGPSPWQHWPPRQVWPAAQSAGPVQDWPESDVQPPSRQDPVQHSDGAVQAAPPARQHPEPPQWPEQQSSLPPHGWPISGWQQ